MFIVVGQNIDMRITVSRLKAHLENGAVLLQPEYHEFVTGYKNNMESLVTYLRSLSGEWERYIASMERVSEF